jgi:hypothetical protein
LRMASVVEVMGLIWEFVAEHNYGNGTKLISPPPLTRYSPGRESRGGCGETFESALADDTSGCIGSETDSLTY